jgi:hypothetical protein
MIGKEIIGKYGTPETPMQAMDIRLESITRFLDEQGANPLIEHLRITKARMEGQHPLGEGQPQINGWSSFKKMYPDIANNIEELLK